MKLSIYIPTHNRYDFLVTLLKKLTHTKLCRYEYEIIISDDSTDYRTYRFFEKSKIPNVKYFKNKRNLGMFPNCNACIARASGQWIHILHDDDTVEKKYFDAVEEYLWEPNVVLISAKTEFEGIRASAMCERHKAKLELIGLEYAIRVNGIDIIRKSLIYGNPFVFSHTIFRRDVAIGCGGFDENLNYVGDFDMWLKIMKEGDIVTVDEICGKYRLHETNYSVSTRARRDGWVESLLITLKYLLLYSDLLTVQEKNPVFQNINENIEKAAFMSDVILDRPVISAILKELVREAQRKGWVRPLYRRLNIYTIGFAVLNCLPSELGKYFYNSILKKKRAVTIKSD